MLLYKEYYRVEGIGGAGDRQMHSTLVQACDDIKNDIGQWNWRKGTNKRHIG